MSAHTPGILHRIDGNVHVCYPVPDGSMLKAAPVKALHDAAPKLLQALQNLLGYWDLNIADDDPAGYETAMYNAHLAIAAATATD